MIVVRSGRKVTLIQAELDDFFGIRRNVKNYNLNNEAEAKLIYLILHPLEWRRLKRAIKKNESTAKSIQRHLCKVFAFHKKIKAQKKEKEPTFQSNIIPIEKKIEKTIARIAEKKIEQKIDNRIDTKAHPAQKIDPKIHPKSHPVQKPLVSMQGVTQSHSGFTKEATKRTPIISEEIVKQFGNDGELEILCPFCRSELNFHLEDIDRRGFKSTRICDVCESINRVSVSMGNRSVFNDFEAKHPEIRSIIKKLENDAQDEFGNPIITYAFQNIK
jgi:hypothetical protein